MPLGAAMLGVAIGIFTRFWLCLTVDPVSLRMVCAYARCAAVAHGGRFLSVSCHRSGGRVADGVLLTMLTCAPSVALRLWPSTRVALDGLVGGLSGGVPSFSSEGG